MRLESLMRETMSSMVPLALELKMGLSKANVYFTLSTDSDLPSDFSIHEFLATCQDYPYVMDNLVCYTRVDTRVRISIKEYGSKYIRDFNKIITMKSLIISLGK